MDAWPQLCLELKICGWVSLRVKCKVWGSFCCRRSVGYVWCGLQIPKAVSALVGVGGSWCC